jgi:hypothetical protein
MFVKWFTPLGPQCSASQVGFSDKRGGRIQLNVSYLDIGKESQPFHLFVFDIIAKRTRDMYITRLKKFFEIIGIDREKNLTIQERYKIFLDKSKSE